MLSPRHGAPQLVQPDPGGLVARQFQQTLQFHGAGALPVAGDTRHRSKPSPEAAPKYPRRKTGECPPACLLLPGGLGTPPTPAAKSPHAPPLPPGLQVSLAFGHLTYEGPPYLGDQMLLFTVANPSDRPAQLTGIRLPLENGTNMVFPHLDGEKRLPCMIEPGTSSKFWVKLSDVEASIRSKGYAGSLNLHAVASDGLGNDYESNTVTVGKP